MFNLMKTAILMAAITALFMLLGQMWGGRSGMMLALLIALGLNFFSYWFSDKIVLRMYNAQEVSEADAPLLYGVTRDLAEKANMPMPRTTASQSSFSSSCSPREEAVVSDICRSPRFDPMRMAFEAKGGQPSVCRVCPASGNDVPFRPVGLGNAGQR